MTTDLDFFPSLPASWQRLPLKAVCDYRVSNVDKVPADDELPVRLCNYTDVYKNEFIRLDMDLMQTTATAAEIARFGLAVGDVAITKDSETWDDIGVPAYIAESAPDLVCGYHLAMLRGHPSRLDGRFLFRCLQARPMQFQFERTATGVTRFGLPIDAIGRLCIPVPPLGRQRAIADYLDRETAKLDAMVAAKQRLLDLLAEKRRALITHAVTHGLNPNVPLGNSNIEWLGEIPAHWKILRLKFLVTKMEQGWSPQCFSYPAAPEDWGVVKAGCCNGGVFNSDDNKALPADIEPPTDLEIRPGDVLMSRASGSRDLIGSAAVVPEGTRSRLLLSDKTYRLRVQEAAISPSFLVLVLGSRLGRYQIEQVISGG